MNQNSVQAQEHKQKLNAALKVTAWALFLFSAGVFLVRVFSAIPFSATSRLYDFGWYHYAFTVVWRHLPSAFLYERWRELQWMHQYLQGTPWHIDPGSQYLYPPQFAVLFSWLAVFQVHAANVVWDFILTGSYLTAVSLLILMIRQDHKRISAPLILLLISFALLWQPFQSDIYWGNSDSLLFFLVILTFYLKDYRQRPLLAGIPLGLAVLFKVTPVILLLLLLIKRQRTSVGAVITIAVGTIIASFQVGWKVLLYYILHFETMAHKSAVLNGNGGSAPWNSSVSGVLQLLRQEGLVWVTPALIGTAFTLFASTVLVLLSMKVFSRRISDKDQIGMLVLSLILLSPVIEDHYIVLTLAPFLFTAASHIQQWSTFHPPQRVFSAGGLGAALVLINPVGGPMIHFYNQAVPIHYFLGILIIAAFAFFPINKASSPH